MATHDRGARAAHPAGAGRAGSAAHPRPHRRNRTVASLAALLLALTAAATATAKSTEISLVVEGGDQVLVGERHELLITATKTADDPSNPIGCIALTPPMGWTGARVEAGLQPASGWSPSDGPPLTWSANTGAGKLRNLGGTAQVRVSIAAPALPGVGTWGIALHDSQNCTDTPMLTTNFEVSAVTEIVEPEASLLLSPMTASVTVGAAHAITATASWIEPAGRSIGCLVATLPAGWTSPDYSGGSPTGWEGDVDGASVAWAAGADAVRISTPGSSSAFTITATAPATTGTYEWDVNVYAAEDCSGMAMLSGTAQVTVTAVPAGGGGGATATTAAEDVSPILATNPPVPQVIPAGEGPTPLSARAGTAAVLASLAAAAAAAAALLRRRSSEADAIEPEEVRAG
jgi:hypothetical protein